MPLSASDMNINWEQFEYIKTFGSQNIVFCLTNAAGESLYVKFVSPGEGVRSKFATEVVESTGLTSYKSRIVRCQYKVVVKTDGTNHWNQIEYVEGSEWKKIVDAVQYLAEGTNWAIEQNAGNIGYQHEILIMDNVKEGKNVQTFRKVHGQKGNQILTLMNRDEFIHDVGRMIAADIILGNYDRISYVHDSYAHQKALGEVSTAVKFHIENFFVDPDTGHIVPIDNDAALISLCSEHDNKERWRNVLVQGGSYSATIGDFIPSLNKILSPIFSETVIKRIIKNRFRQDIDALGIDMTNFYRRVAASIREGVREIIAKLKKNGDAEGLNKRLKNMLNEYGDVSKLDYEAFKLKMRYAMVVTDPNDPADESTAETYTTEYHEYRDWKNDLMQALNSFSSFITDHPLPDNPFPSMPSEMNIATKGFRKFKTKLSSVAHTTHYTTVTKAHLDKSRIRAIKQDGAELQKEIGRLKTEVLKNVTDRSAKKAYAEAAIFLTTLDMLELKEMISNCMILINQIPLNAKWTHLYMNTLRKHAIPARIQVESIFSRYNTYCARLAINCNANVVQDMNQAKENLRRECENLGKIK